MSRLEGMESTGFKTRMRVVEALAEIAGEGGFEKATINSICKSAGISRSTFYYHFDDKYDVIQWHFNTVASSCLDEIGRTLTWRQGYLKHTSEVLRHGELYPTAFRVRGYQSLFSHVKRHRRETIRETITQYLHLELDSELEFQIFALSDVEVGCMGHWFKEGMPYDMHRLCQYLEDVVPRRLHDLLDKPVNPLPW